MTALYFLLGVIALMFLATFARLVWQLATAPEGEEGEDE